MVWVGRQSVAMGATGPFALSVPNLKLAGLGVGLYKRNSLELGAYLLL